MTSCALGFLPVIWALASVSADAGRFRCPDGTRGTVARVLGVTVLRRQGMGTAVLLGRRDACPATGSTRDRRRRGLPG